MLRVSAHRQYPRFWSCEDVLYRSLPSCVGAAVRPNTRLIGLAIGLESPGDLIADLDAALSTAHGPAAA